MEEITPWIEEEMAKVDLGHKARDKRLKIVMSQLAAMPAASIPAAVGGGRAETEAAYRMFDNEAIEFDHIILAHTQCTLNRVRQSRVVILTQDTSEIDLTRPEQQVSGAGPLDDGARRGCLIHPVFAVDEQGIPFGTVRVECWTREESSSDAMTRAAKERQRKQTPIEEKESQRWITGMRAAHRTAVEAPNTEVIMVADSEADIFELMVEGQSLEGRAEWIVRACQDRAVRLEKDAENDAARSITQALQAATCHATYEVNVRGRQPKVSCETRGRRQPRETRTATVECRACSVTLRAPYRPDRKLPDVTVNAVRVREVASPKDEEPIEWLLLTSLPITNAEQVLRVIRTYSQRWSIEIFFRIMKQGLKVERRRFETIDRLKRFLALSVILSWRVFYIARLGREFPDIDCEAVFEPSEWKAVYQVTQRRNPPKKAPKLREMVRMVAQLGGYVNRPRSDEPGAETIWKGLQRMHDMAVCWDLFGPERR
jgi:hypothetical protein